MILFPNHTKCGKQLRPLYFNKDRKMFRIDDGLFCPECRQVVRTELHELLEDVS